MHPIISRQEVIRDIRNQRRSAGSAVSVAQYVAFCTNEREREALYSTLDALCSEGLLEERDGAIRLTEKGEQEVYR